jgi:hypothetical protein
MSLNLSGKTMSSVRRAGLCLAVAVTLSWPFAALGEEKKAESLPSVGLEATIETTTGQQTGLGRVAGVSTLVGNIIGAVLGFVGVIFFVLVIYAGFLWMTAGGGQEQLGKAKKIFTTSIIGLFIVVMAYYLVDFVFGALEQSLINGAV